MQAAKSVRLDMLEREEFEMYLTHLLDRCSRRHHMVQDECKIAHFPLWSGNQVKSRFRRLSIQVILAISSFINARGKFDRELAIHSCLSNRYFMSAIIDTCK